MRLFTGLSLPPHIIANLEALVRKLSPQPQLRWTVRANLHITTKFIGEWPEDRIPELTSALEEMPRGGPIQIALEGLGCFSHALIARVLPSPELGALAGKTESALGRLGVPVEKRAYNPHVTLARASGPRALGPLRTKLENLALQPLGAFEAREFYLYESKRSVYSKMAAFPLK
jgi:RNA 2',3'-cyclic 3'-phosphodiesterase